jgi:hypothetical protein
MPARVLATRVLDSGAARSAPTIVSRDGAIVARCGGGGALVIRALEVDGQPIDAAAFATRFGCDPIPLGT